MGYNYQNFKIDFELHMKNDNKWRTIFQFILPIKQKTK
jgi:hypothetical protein